MSVEAIADFYRQLGHWATPEADCVWYRVREGFVVRVPHHVIRPVTAQAAASLLRRRAAFGLRYSLAAGQPGQPGGVYFVRDPGYDLPQLAGRLRNRIRRGLRQCTVRRLAFSELCEQGLPLNHDTLQRQGRTDLCFTEPKRWEHLCQAAAGCSALHAWGAFAGGELAAYSIVMHVGAVAVQLYQMSRTALLPLEVNPALNFTLTYELIRSPGITAVSFGHVGLDSTAGLDEYKRSLGYQREPVTFVVQLRPGLRPALLSPVTAAVVARLGRHWPKSHFVQRLQAVLDIAGQSGALPAGDPPVWGGTRSPDRAN